MMGPEIRDKPEILHLVKSFETGMAERRRRADDDHQPPPARKTGGVETGHSGGTP
jgi:hypothetical protein